MNNIPTKTPCEADVGKNKKILGELNRFQKKISHLLFAGMISVGSVQADTNASSSYDFGFENLYGNDWKSYVDPLDLIVTKQYGGKKIITVAVPMKYTQNFKEGNFSSEEDRKKLLDYIIAELNKGGVIDINSLSEAQDRAYFRKHFSEMTSRQHLQQVTIEGFSSPEGGNPGSEQIGHIDPQNTQLALLRANAVGQALESIGVKDLWFDGQEIQFNQSEISQLETAMREGKYASIFDLIQAYNDGKVDKNKLLETYHINLDALIGEKRKVQVTFSFHQPVSEVYIIPLSAVLLLLLSFLYSRTKKARENIERLCREPSILETFDQRPSLLETLDQRPSLLETLDQRPLPFDPERNTRNNRGNQS